MKKKPEFVHKSCMACRVCGQTCPVSCIQFEDTSVDRYQKAYPVLTEGCIGCSLCESSCFYDAIVMEG